MLLRGHVTPDNGSGQKAALGMNSEFILKLLAGSPAKKTGSGLANCGQILNRR